MVKKWEQIGSDIDGEAAKDFSGRSVSLSSDVKTVAIGAPDNKGKKGHVRIYQLKEVSKLEELKQKKANIKNKLKKINLSTKKREKLKNKLKNINKKIKQQKLKKKK